MAKNKVQFQHGMSLSQFLSNGSEEQCRTALFKMRWPHGFECQKCGYVDGYSEIHSRKVYQCHRCHFHTSLTRQTIFASTKLPLNIWVLSIYLITQAKDGISSLNMARTLGIPANAALRMKHKLQQVMKGRDDSQPLCGLLLMDEACWPARSVTAKETVGFPRKCPLLLRSLSLLTANLSP